MTTHFQRSSDNSYPTNKRHFSTRKPRRHPASLLPPPSVLQAYEDVAQGSVAKLMAMVEREQKHRHEWEIAQLQCYMRSYRIGQYIGLIAVISIVGGCSYLASLGDMKAATTLAIAGFTTLMFAMLFSYKTRQFSRRPKRGQDDKRPFNKEKPTQ
ncbi:MAG: DUF2335 domain-containing protein [Burkholderiales bacterium]